MQPTRMQGKTIRIRARNPVMLAILDKGEGFQRTLEKMIQGTGPREQPENLSWPGLSPLPLYCIYATPVPDGAFQGRAVSQRSM